MIRWNLYLFVFCTFICQALAQTNIKLDSVQLFYNINETRSEINFSRVDSVFNTIGKEPVKIKITGYADFLSNSGYNLTLSQKRADAVRNYLQSKHASALMQIISCKGVGEKYSRETNSKEGAPYQRRVVIIVEKEGKTEIVKTENPAEGEKTKETEKQELKKELEGLSEGQSLSLQGLTFIPGRHVMVKGSMPILEKLLKTLRENKNLKIQIQGHVCCTSGQDDGLDYDTHERKLSENRAKAIYDYLISKGISANRLSYKGFGHSKPLYPNESTPEEEQANRRVEILIVEK